MFDTHEKKESQNCWYALRTKSRHEKVVRERLVREGVETLLPTMKRLSRWKDRKKEVEVPLFSGYCFARFTWPERISVLSVSGVVNLVGSGNDPEPLPIEEISALQTLMISTLRYDFHPYLHEGQEVEVIRGPLQQVRGIIVRKEGGHRLILSVRLIQQAVAVEIDASDVAPI